MIFVLLFFVLIFLGGLALVGGVLLWMGLSRRRKPEYADKRSPKVLFGLGLAILPELTIDEFPGDYDTRMLEPEAYRTLGIGLRSYEYAGPLAKFVIKFIMKNIR